ncbi:unnamed protein product [Cuscuta epithymum]|uniref:Secreted protein n=1 Tax=Cuscuta epithymum TaxID=186058 RepID=A0AAV0GIV6_9ASTE|nr:unnamed protein product [Cuscuta epithymum]
MTERNFTPVSFYLLRTHLFFTAVCLGNSPKAIQNSKPIFKLAHLTRVLPLTRPTGLSSTCFRCTGLPTFGPLPL